MEALLNANNKEVMRMAILKHEETFKQQVNELHRLYQIQKILMEAVEKSGYPNRKGEDTCFSQVYREKGASCNNERVQEEVEDGDSSASNGGLDVIDESEIELSLGPSCHGKRKKRETGGRFRYNPSRPPRVSLLLRQATK